ARRPCPADRVVQELQSPRRARHCYPGCATRLRDECHRLGAAVALYRMRGAGCRFRGERGEAPTQIKCGGATGSLATSASGHDPPHPRSLARGSRLQAMYLGELREADRISLPPSTQLTVPALRCESRGRRGEAVGRKFLIESPCTNL